jgi:Chloride channel protein EriC
MTIEERAEQGAVYKKSCNCCQAVLCALADQTGLSPEQLVQLGAGFGSGMGNMEGTCGALVGAGMAAGLSAQGNAPARFGKLLNENFQARCGAILCKDLKGRGTGKILCSCEDCVRNAVRAYGDVIGLK